MSEATTYSNETNHSEINYKELLSIDDCKSILLKDLQHKNFSIKSFDISSLSERIEGFLGEHFVVIIEYDLLQEPFCHCKKRYFMKVLSGASQVVIQMTKALNAFAKEEFFYNFLLRELVKNNIDVSFAPKSYICKSKIVVLEDLSVKEYKTLPKGEFFNIEHCKQALITLVKLHSSSIMYEKQTQDSSDLLTLLQRYPEMFKNVFAIKESNSIVKTWFENSLEGIFQIIKYIYANDAQKDSIVDKLKKFSKNAHSEIFDVNNYHCAVLHGDVWLNNFLFKYSKEQIPQDCILIDYQMINYGPPSLEVLHLLYCNTRKKFRNDHLDELLEFYYDNLQKQLYKCNINDFLPKEEYLRLCEVYELWIKLQCICDRCVTFIPDRYVHERVHNDDDLCRFLLEDRAKEILTCFKEEEQFRELIMEDVEELVELLFKNVV